MKMGVVLVLVLAGLGLSGCAEVGGVLGLTRPTARLEGVRFGDISLRAATLIFDVAVENPYGAALPLTDIDYLVSNEGGKLFEGEAALAGSIPARGSKVLNLPTEIEYGELLRAFRGVRPGTQMPYRAQLGLSVEAPVVGPMRIPINKDGQLYVPNITDVAPSDLSDLVR